MLKVSYFSMKGTSDEFEIIYIAKSKKEFPYNQHIIDSESWLVSLVSELLPINLKLYCCYCHLLSLPPQPCSWCGEGWKRSTMLGFVQNGRVVIKSAMLTFADTDFPFYADSMETEALYELDHFESWMVTTSWPANDLPLYRYLANLFKG